MNTRLKVMTFAAGLLALAMVLGAQAAVTQDNSSTRDIALVDVEYLLDHAAAAKKAFALIEKTRVEDQQAFEAKIDALTKEYEGILDRRAVPSEAEYQRRFSEIQKKAEDYQNEALDRQDEVVSSFIKAYRKIGETIEEIVREIIQKQKLSMVLSKSAIVGTTTVPDITQEVLTRLDKRLPTVAIELAKTDEASAKE